jgi:hypothetical protein
MTCGDLARDENQVCVSVDKSPENRLSCISCQANLRLCEPAPRLAGISGSSRLRAGIPVRDVRGMQSGRRSFAPIPATKQLDLQVFYGATGLEPATSGVTGVSIRFSGLRVAAESARSHGFRQVQQTCLFHLVAPGRFHSVSSRTAAGAFGDRRARQLQSALASRGRMIVRVKTEGGIHPSQVPPDRARARG